MFTKTEWTFPSCKIFQQSRVWEIHLDTHLAFLPPTLHWRIATCCLIQWNTDIWECVACLASMKWRTEGGFHGIRLRRKIIFLGNYYYRKPWRFHEIELGIDIWQRVWWPWCLTATLQDPCNKLFVWINKLCLQTLIESPTTSEENWSCGPELC